MKRLLAVWFALSLVFYIVFGVTVDVNTYLNRFANLQSPLVIVGDVVRSFNMIKDTITNFGSIADVLKLLGGFFGLMINVLTLPFHIIGYLLDVIMTIIPVGIIN